MNRIARSPLFLLGGIAIFAYGALHFFNLVLAPHIAAFKLPRLPWLSGAQPVDTMMQSQGN